MSKIIQWKCLIYRDALNFGNVFNWSVLANAPKNMFQRKVLEAYYIVLEKHTLNEQFDPDRLRLFSNGVTWLHYNVNILTPWVLKS